MENPHSFLLSEIKNRPKKIKECKIIKTSESFFPLTISLLPPKKKNKRF